MRTGTSYIQLANRGIDASALTPIQSIELVAVAIAEKDGRSFTRLSVVCGGRAWAEISEVVLIITNALSHEYLV
jgi:hypothetical protein